MNKDTGRERAALKRTGVPVSDETSQKISTSMKASWARHRAEIFGKRMHLLGQIEALLRVEVELQKQRQALQEKLEKIKLRNAND